MISRNLDQIIENHYANNKSALLLTGARQVGKNGLSIVSSSSRDPLVILSKNQKSCFLLKKNVFGGISVHGRVFEYFIENIN